MSDYFIKGTKPSKITTGQKKVEICEDTGYLATPWCPHTEKKSVVSVNGGESKDMPEYYCNKHNIKPKKYPIDPKKKLNKNFDPDDPDGSKKKKEEKEKKKQEEEEKKKQEEEQQAQETPDPEPEPPAEPEQPATPEQPVTPPDAGTEVQSLNVATHIGATAAQSRYDAYSALNEYFALKWNGGFG
jgi:hypothetical protein